MMKTKIILSVAALLMTAHMAQANDRRGPPPEAFEACEGKSAGDSSEFAGRDGEAITGVCEERDGKMVLHPDNPPSREK